MRDIQVLLLCNKIKNISAKVTEQDNLRCLIHGIIWNAIRAAWKEKTSKL